MFVTVVIGMCHKVLEITEDEGYIVKLVLKTTVIEQSVKD